MIFGLFEFQNHTRRAKQARTYKFPKEVTSLKNVIIKMRDAVYARMLYLVLSEKGYVVSLGEDVHDLRDVSRESSRAGSDNTYDEAVEAQETVSTYDDFVAVTDKASLPDILASADKTILLDYGPAPEEETPGAKIRYFRRPAPLGELLSVIDGLSGGTDGVQASEKDVPPIAPVLNRKKKAFVYMGRSVSLTDTEFRLLSLLFDKKGEVVTVGEMTEKIWNGTVRSGNETNAPAVYVNFLRKKLDTAFERRFIYSVRGKGYIYKE